MVAGRPLVDDARARCPVCGGAIHPIAGRCKHCRTNLVKLREQAALVTQQGAPSPTMPTAPPTGTAVPSRWRPTWPVVVAVLAGIAIVVSVVLLVIGSPQSEATPRRLKPPPAPDRMPTAPMPAPVMPAPSDPQLKDPFGSVDPWQQGNKPPRNPAQGSRDLMPQTSFAGQMSRNICERFTSCGLIDPQAGIDCDMLSGMVMPGLSSLSGDDCTYDAADAHRCLDAIKAMPCPSEDTLSQPMGLAGLLASCAALDCRTP